MDEMKVQKNLAPGQALSRRLHKQHMDFITMVNRKKKGLFRDIIIESDYNPLQARKCGHPLSPHIRLAFKDAQLTDPPSLSRAPPPPLSSPALSGPL